MRISNFLLFICLIAFLSCKNSEPSKYYIIDGKINNYNGKIYLTNAVDSKYYPDNFIKDSAIALDGKFKFKLSKKFNIPFPFHLETDKTRTNRFILEPKDQLIIIDSLYFNTIPKIESENSTINLENKILKERMSPFLLTFKAKFDEFKKPDFPKDSIEKFAIAAREKLTYDTNLILENFSKEYPYSYVAFWEIIVRQMYNGYQKELESAYNNLSNNLRQTAAGKEFESKMIEGTKLSMGSHFPKMQLKNTALKELVLNVSENSSTNYILVDLWFSFCGPCIAQFPELKELYSNYNPKDLKIISISTDITKNVDNWHKVIENYNIPWINLLDENGVETSPLGINSFPTNYLLDGKGVILNKNISLVDLEALLKELN